MSRGDGVFSLARLPPAMSWQLRTDLLGMIVCLRDLYLEGGVAVRLHPTLSAQSAGRTLSSSRTYTYPPVALQGHTR